jgi:hypothetical protein
MGKVEPHSRSRLYGEKKNLLLSGYSVFFRNVGINLPDDTVSYPRGPTLWRTNQQECHSRNMTYETGLHEENSVLTSRSLTQSISASRSTQTTLCSRSAGRPTWFCRTPRALFGPRERTCTWRTCSTATKFWVSSPHNEHLAHSTFVI